MLNNAAAQTIPESSAQLPEVVITAAKMSLPLTIVTDPKAPRQPVLRTTAPII